MNLPRVVLSQRTQVAAGDGEARRFTPGVGLRLGALARPVSLGHVVGCSVLVSPPWIDVDPAAAVDRRGRRRALATRTDDGSVTA
jgi:hypothetical protein